MRNRRLVKIQLLLLVIVAALLVWRANVTLEKGDGLVQFVDLDKGELYEDSFTLRDSTTLYISAVATFETDSPQSELAAYPWIVGHSSKTPVWIPEADRLTRDGVEANIEDSVRLAPGSYTAYYSTYGPKLESKDNGSFLSLKPHWSNDERLWNLRLTTAPGLDSAVRSESGPSRVGSKKLSEALWAFQPTRHFENESQMIQVVSTTELNLKGIAALCSSSCDTISIFKVPETSPFWTLDAGKTDPAGGSVHNRAFSSNVSLEPGLYRVEYKTGNRQAYGKWRENPPWIPEDWGLRVFASSPSGASVFDPWRTSTPLVALLKMQDDEDRSMTLELDDTLTVVTYSMGEMTSNDSRYDYGWIEKKGRATPVWEMWYDKTTPAGGGDKNRREMAVLTLDPGIYFVKYVSDGSHSYEDWNTGRPAQGEQWGIALFALNPADVNPASVRVSETVQRWTTVEETTDLTIDKGNALVQRNRLGNDVQVEESLKLSEETELAIVAAGELTGSSSYDYGWIERYPSQEKVWEMTYQNTVPAGGADRNRRFSGTITLGPGDYRVRFQTDFSHSFGNFDDDRPERGEDWGIVIYRVDQ